MPWIVRHSLHSYDPRWFRMKYGSFARSIVLEREASEAFAAVDRRVLLGRDAGAADLAAVLARVHETLRWFDDERMER